MILSTIFAIIFGFSFGVVLQQIGASNRQSMLDMLQLRSAHLWKILLFAVGASSITLFLISSLFPDTAQFGVKTAFVGVVIGGTIFGAGFALSGYCPGTALVAAGELKKDAFVFILGGILGVFAYSLIYGSIKNSWLFNEIFGGATTLAETGASNFSSLVDFLPAIAVAGIISTIFLGAAWGLTRWDREHVKNLNDGDINE